VTEVRHDRGCAAGVAPSARCTCLAPETWAYICHLAPALYDDPPAREAMLAHHQAVAVEQATAQGYTLATKAAARVSVERTVTVPDWSEDGDSWVPPEVARLTGHDPDLLAPGPVMVRFEWQIAPGGR
jgi:hypothetical protein